MLMLTASVLAQDVGPKMVKVDPNEADASLKRPLALNMDACQVPSGKTFTAEVSLKVTPDGLPVKVALSQTSGYPCLDDVALDAVKVARFNPATHHGRPVIQDVVMPVDFARMDMNASGAGTVSGVLPASVLKAPRLQAGSCRTPSGAFKTIVGLTVDVSGNPTNVRVATSSGDPCLDEAALRNAALYRFNPAQRAGQPVAFDMKLEMQFNQ